MSGTCLDVFGGISRFLILMFAIVTARFSPLTTVLPHHQVEDRPDLNSYHPPIITLSLNLLAQLLHQRTSFEYHAYSLYFTL